MPWNGSGSFTRTDGTRNGMTVWAQAKAAGVKILSADQDTHDQDLATGLNNCLTKDGQNAPTANLPMNNKKLTGLAAGANAGDSVRFEQFGGEGTEFDSGVLRVKLDGTTLTRSASGIAVNVSALSIFSTGDVKATLKAVADAGWIMMDDGTIGNAASSATTRANADTEALFTLLWNNCADAQCAVSGGRGASAAADFAANKRIAIPKILGRAIGAAGAGSGLTSRVLGLATGAETTTDVAEHTHDFITGSGTAHSHIERGTDVEGTTPVDMKTYTGHAAGISFNTLQYVTETTGSGTGTDLKTADESTHTHSGTSDASGVAAVSIMPPIAFLNFMIKL